MVQRGNKQWEREVWHDHFFDSGRGLGEIKEGNKEKKYKKTDNTMQERETEYIGVHGKQITEGLLVHDEAYLQVSTITRRWLRPG